MVDINSVGSSSFDPWTLDPDDEPPRAATPPRTAAPPPDPSELYEKLAPNGPPLLRAAASPHLMLAAGLRAADVAPAIDSGLATVPLVKQRMDAFKAAATATYHLPGEGDVQVAARFRMPVKADPKDVPFGVIEGRIRTLTPEVLAAGANQGVSPGRVATVQVGRGTPEEVQKLTQGLINLGKLPPPQGPKDTPAMRVQRLMFDHGIGFDCAGYVQQAFTAAHGITRAQAGFTPNVTDEGLFDPSAKGPFRRVRPEQAQAGDIVVLQAPPGESTGHRLLVYSRHDLQPEELRAYKGIEPKDRKRIQSGRISVFEVDSSYGSGGTPTAGGVQRQKWIYDAASNTWGRFTSEGSGPDPSTRSASFRFTSRGLPYDGLHPLGGVYHYQGRP